MNQSNNMKTYELCIKKPKSKMIVGNIICYNEKRFNWFQKLCFKSCFGIMIVDIKDEE